MTFTIAIIGRPNVGKSTLFNRLVGRRLALVDKAPGLTRDRRDGEAQIGDRAMRFIDTAGLEDAEPGSVSERMRSQSLAAAGEADLVIFAIDARAGVIPADQMFAEIVRNANKPVLLVANKCEGRAGSGGFFEAYELGFGEPIAVSAEHGEGMGELYSALLAEQENWRSGLELSRPHDEGEKHDDADTSTRPLKIAVIGRPNAGKSTLVNTLLGQDRMITGPEAGITRDAISVELDWQGRPLRLFDTAGLRRKSRITQRPEQLSVGDALRAIRFAEVVILLLDADCPLERQDLNIAALAANEGRAIVIGVNKWDLVEDAQTRIAEIRREAEHLLPQIKGVAILPVSARSGRGVDKLMNAVLQANRLWNARVTTAKLNRWLAETSERHPPPAVRGRRIRMRFATQSNARPPTFVLFCSRPDEVPGSYVRYLVNALRDAFRLPGVPIRLHLRKRDNPYDKT